MTYTKEQRELDVMNLKNWALDLHAQSREFESFDQKLPWIRRAQLLERAARGLEQLEIRDG